MNILLIEDDHKTASYLVSGLNQSGHQVEHASDGELGLELATSGQFEVLIVDRMLPKLDGLSIIKTLRKSKIETPALILSALGEVDDRVQGLRSGGDDYLVKPFSFDELLARIEVLARRTQTVSDNQVYRVGDLELNRLNHKVLRGGTNIELMPREFRLLEYLMKNQGRILTRTMLLEKVWDYNFDPQTNVIDVHISRLRSKIGKGFATQLLKTVRGAGYMMSDAE